MIAPHARNHVGLRLWLYERPRQPREPIAIKSLQVHFGGTPVYAYGFSGISDAVAIDVSWQFECSGSARVYEWLAACMAAKRALTCRLLIVHWADRFYMELPRTTMQVASTDATARPGALTDYRARLEGRRPLGKRGRGRMITRSF